LHIYSTPGFFASLRMTFVVCVQCFLLFQQESDLTGRLKTFTVLFALLLAASACSGRPESYSKTRVIMGTYVTITAERGDLPEILTRAAVFDAFAEIERVDRLMSTYKQDSQLSEINRQAGIRPVKVDPEVMQAVKDALEVSRMTAGGFDPTVGPLVRLWGIGHEGARVPAPDEIKKALAVVNYKDVAVDAGASTVYLTRKGMYLDLGGSAKGYASDRAVDVLKSKGIKGGIVAVAGDVRLFGSRSDSRPWGVGIQHPRDKGGLLAKLELTDAAVSTSGDYERFFIKDHTRYHHIFDPSTGYPAKGLMSLTVVAKEASLADPLTTGLFVLGPDKAYAFANAHPEFSVLMVTSKGEILKTGLFKSIRIDGPITPTQD